MNIKIRFRVDLLVIAVMMLFLPGIYSRGHSARLIDPPPRRSLWRLGYPTPKDINDAAPVFTRQTLNYDASLKLCGLPAMQSSKKLKIYVVQQYIQGIPMEVKVTKSFGLFGSTSFALCDISDGNTISEECFQENVLNVLKIEQMGSSKRRMNETILLTLSPPQIKCEHCVLQWKYTIKSMACPRCDPLYQFISCADIAIVDPKDIQYMNVMMSKRQKRQAPNSQDVGSSNSESVPIFFPEGMNVAVSHPPSDSNIAETRHSLNNFISNDVAHNSRNTGVNRHQDGSGVSLTHLNNGVVSTPNVVQNNFRTSSSNTQSGSNNDRIVNTLDRDQNRVSTNGNSGWSSADSLSFGNSMTWNTRQILDGRSTDNASGNRLNSESTNHNPVWTSASESGTRVDQSVNRLEGSPIMFSPENNVRSSLTSNSAPANDMLPASSANVGNNNFDQSSSFISGRQVQTETVYQPSMAKTTSNLDSILDGTVSQLEQTSTSLSSAGNTDWSSKSSMGSENRGMLNNAQNHDQSVFNSGSGGFMSHNQISTSSSKVDLGSSANDMGTGFAENSNRERAIINKPGSNTVSNTNSINYRHTSSTGGGQQFNGNNIHNSGSFSNLNQQRTSANSAPSATSRQKAEVSSNYEFNSQNDIISPGTFSRESSQWVSSDNIAFIPAGASVTGSTSNLNNQQWSAANSVRFNSGGTESNPNYNRVDGIQSGSTQFLNSNINSNGGQLSNVATGSDSQLKANNQQRTTSSHGTQNTDSRFANRQKFHSESSNRQSLSSINNGINSDGAVEEIYIPSSDTNKQWSSSTDNVSSRKVVDSHSNQRRVSRNNAAIQPNNYINYPPGLVIPSQSVNTNTVVTNYKTHKDSTNNEQSGPTVVQGMGIPVGNFYTEYSQVHSAAKSEYEKDLSEPTANVVLNSQRNVGGMTNDWSASNKIESRTSSQGTHIISNPTNIVMSDNSANTLSSNTLHSIKTSGEKRENPSKPSLVYRDETSSFVVSSPSISSQSLLSTGNEESIVRTESTDASTYTEQPASSVMSSTGNNDYRSINGKRADVDLFSSSQHNNNTDQRGSDSMNSFTDKINNTPKTTIGSGSSVLSVAHTGGTESGAKNTQASNQIVKKTTDEGNQYVSTINQESLKQSFDIQQGQESNAKTTNFSGSDILTGSNSGISQGSANYQASSNSNFTATIQGENDKRKATTEPVSNMSSGIGNDFIVSDSQTSLGSNQASVPQSNNQDTVQSNPTLTSITTRTESSFYDSTISGGNTGNQRPAVRGSDATGVSHGRIVDSNLSISTSTSQTSNNIIADQRNITDGSASKNLPQAVDTGPSNTLSSGQIQMINNENSKLTTFNSGQVSAYIVEKPSTVEGEKIPDDSAALSGLRLSEFTSDGSQYSDASKTGPSASSTLQDNTEKPQNMRLPLPTYTGSSINEVSRLGTVSTGSEDGNAFTSGLNDEAHSTAQSSTKTVTDQGDPLGFSFLTKSEDSASLSSKSTPKQEIAKEISNQDSASSANKNDNNQASRGSPFSSSNEFWPIGGETTINGEVTPTNTPHDRTSDVNRQSMSVSSSSTQSNVNSNLDWESTLAFNVPNTESGTDTGDIGSSTTKYDQSTSGIFTKNTDGNNFLAGISDENKASADNSVKLDQSISVPIDSTSQNELGTSDMEPHALATSTTKNQNSLYLEQKQDDANLFRSSVPTNESTTIDPESYGTGNTIISRSSSDKKAIENQFASNNQPITGIKSLKDDRNLFYGFTDTNFNTAGTSDNRNQIHQKSTEDKSTPYQTQGDGLIIGSESGYSNPINFEENDVLNIENTNLPKYYITDGKSGILSDTVDIKNQMDETKLTINSNTFESSKVKENSPSLQITMNDITSGTADVDVNTVTSTKKGYDDLNAIPDPDADLSKSSLFSGDGNFVFMPSESRRKLDTSLNLGQKTDDYKTDMNNKGSDQSLSEFRPEIKPHRTEDSTMQPYSDSSSDNNVFYGFESFKFGQNRNNYPRKVHKTINTNSMRVFLNSFQHGDMRRPFNEIEWHRIKTGKEVRHNLGLSGNTLNVHVGNNWDQTPTVLSESRDSDDDRRRRVFTGFGINKYDKNKRKFPKQSDNYIFRNTFDGDNKLLSIGKSGGIFSHFGGKKPSYDANTIENLKENFKVHSAEKENVSKLNIKGKKDDETYFTGFDTSFWTGINKLAQDDSLLSQNIADSGADSSTDKTPQSPTTSAQDRSIVLDRNIGASSTKQENKDDGFMFTGFDSYGYEQSNKRTFDFSESNRLHEYDMSSNSDSRIPISGLSSTNTYDYHANTIKETMTGDDKSKHNLNKVNEKKGMIFTGFDSFGDQHSGNILYDDGNTAFQPKQRSDLFQTDDTSKTFTAKKSKKVNDDSNKSEFPLWRRNDEQLFTGFDSLQFGSEGKETEIDTNRQQQTSTLSKSSNKDDKRKTSSTFESYFDSNTLTNSIDGTSKMQNFDIDTKTSAFQSTHGDNMLARENNNVYDDINRNKNIEHVSSSLIDTQPYQNSVNLGFDDVGNSESQKISKLNRDDSNIDLMSASTALHNEQNLLLDSPSSQSLKEPIVSSTSSDHDGYMVTTFPSDDGMNIGYNQEMTSQAINFTTKSVDMEDALPPAADFRLSLPVPQLPSTLDFNALSTSTESYTAHPSQYQSTDDRSSVTSSTNEQFPIVNNNEGMTFSKSNFHNVEISGDMRDNMLGGTINNQQKDQQTSKFWEERNIGNFGIHDDGINFVSPTTTGSILATTEAQIPTETTAPTLTDLQRNTVLAGSVSGIRTAEISSNGVWKQPIMDSMFTSATREEDAKDSPTLPAEQPSTLLTSDDLFTHFNFVSPPNTMPPTVTFDTQNDVIDTQTGLNQIDSVRTNTEDNAIKISSDDFSTTGSYAGQSSNLLSNEVDRFNTKLDSKKSAGDFNTNTKSDFTVSSHSVYVSETTTVNRNDTHSGNVNINANAMDQKNDLYLPSTQETNVATTGTTVNGAGDMNVKQSTEKSTFIRESSSSDSFNVNIPNNIQATNLNYDTTLNEGGTRTHVDDASLSSNTGTVTGQSTYDTTEGGTRTHVDMSLSSNTVTGQSTYDTAEGGIRTRVDDASLSSNTVTGQSTYDTTEGGTHTRADDASLGSNTGTVTGHSTYVTTGGGTRTHVDDASLRNTTGVVTGAFDNTPGVIFGHMSNTGTATNSGSSYDVNKLINNLEKNQNGQDLYVKATDIDRTSNGVKTIDESKKYIQESSQSSYISQTSNLASTVKTTDRTDDRQRNLNLDQSNNRELTSANRDSNVNIQSISERLNNLNSGFLPQDSPSLHVNQNNVNTDVLSIKNTESSTRGNTLPENKDLLTGGAQAVYIITNSNIETPNTNGVVQNLGTVNSQSNFVDKKFTLDRSTNTADPKYVEENKSTWLQANTNEATYADGTSPSERNKEVDLNTNVAGGSVVAGFLPESPVHDTSIQPSLSTKTTTVVSTKSSTNQDINTYKTENLKEGLSGADSGGFSVINSDQSITHYKEDSKTGTKSGQTQPHNQQSGQNGVSLENLKSIGLGGSSNNEQLVFNPVNVNGNDYLRQQELERERISMARKIAFSRSLLDDILLGNTDDKLGALGGTDTQPLSGGIAQHSATSDNLLKIKSSNFNSVSQPLVSNGENVLIGALPSTNNDAFTRSINRALDSQNANSGADGSPSTLQKSESSMSSLSTSSNGGDIRSQGADTSFVSSSSLPGNGVLGQASTDLLTGNTINGGSQTLLNSGSLSAIQNGLHLSTLGPLNGGANTLLTEANNNIQATRVSQLAGQQNGAIDTTDASSYSGQEAITFANSLNGNIFTTTHPTVSTQEALILSNALNFNGVNGGLGSVGSGSLLGDGLLNERTSNTIGTEFSGNINNSPSFRQQVASTAFSTSSQSRVINGPGIPSSLFSSSQHPERINPLAKTGDIGNAAAEIARDINDHRSASLNTETSSQSLDSSSSMNNVRNITRTITSIDSSTGNNFGGAIEHQVNNGQNNVNGGTMLNTNRHGETSVTVESNGPSSPDSTIANFYKTSSFTIVSGRTPQNVCPNQSLVCGAKGDFALTFRSNLWCITNCLSKPSTCQNKRCNCHCIPSGFTEADLRGSFTNLISNAYTKGRSQNSDSPGTIVSSNNFLSSEASNSFHKSIVSSPPHSSLINSLVGETTPKPTPKSTTQRKIHQATRNNFASGRVLVCKGRGVYEQVDGMVQWCETECGRRRNPNCYTSTCKCTLI